MILPTEIIEALRKVLEAAEDTGEIRQVTPVTGGCINHAVRLETTRRVYLLKWNQHPNAGMFACEVEGLRLLSAAHTVRVPEIIGIWEGSPSLILLEFIESPTSKNGWNQEQLGAQLAEMHLKTSKFPGQRYGLAQDNFIGSSSQPNGWQPDWITFFKDQRLAHQMHLAQKNGRLTPTRARHLERLMDRLPNLLGTQHLPSLLHGDLWSGNVIADPEGAPVLIDPAVYYGDREAEIAYTELFGGFTQRFYQAYQHVWPLEPGYPERRDIYNLYHLLNHLNLFGETYGSHVDAILRYYG